MSLPLFNQRIILRSILIVFVLLINLLSVRAQTFKWALQQPLANWMVGTGGHFAVTDQEGNVYMACQFYGSQDFDPSPRVSILAPLGDYPGIYISKFDTAGNLLWVKCVLSNSGFVEGLIVDKQNNVIVVGGYSSVAYYERNNEGIDSTLDPGGMAIFLTKYDSKGNFLWLKTAAPTSEGSGSTIESIGGIRTDTDNNIYIGGKFTRSYDFSGGSGIPQTTIVNSSNQNCGFFAKYDSSGQCKWANAIVDADTPAIGLAEVHGIAIDTLDNVYLTGYFGGTLDFDPGLAQARMTTAGFGEDIFIVKLDKSGRYQWSKSMGGTGRDLANSISIGGLGSIYVSGVFQSLDADFDPGPDTALLPYSATSIQDLFFAKYDAEGNYQWAKSIVGNGIKISCATIADEVDNFYLPGFLAFGSLDLDPGPDTTILRLTNAAAISAVGFVAKYDACGNFKSGFKVGSEQDFDFMNLVSIYVHPAVDGSVDAYAAGSFSASTDFDFGPDSSILRPNETTDAFLLKVNYSDDLVRVTACGEQYAFNGNVYTESGRYRQVIGLQENGGCDSIYVLQLKLSKISEPIITVNVFVLDVLNAYTYNRYQWLKDGSLIAGATDSVYTVSENADYQVIVYNEEGCVDTSEVYKVTNTFVKEFGGKADIRIYPNPATEMVYISSAIPVQVQLTDIGGRTVMEQQSVQSFSIKTLTAGMYMMRIRDAQGTLLKVEKLVKAD